LESFAANIGETIFALFVDSQRVGIRRYEHGGSAEVALRLTPIVIELLDRGCAAMASIIARYESPADLPSSDRELDDDIFAPRPATARSPVALVGDIAFMASAEMRQHHHRLQTHRPDGDTQEMIRDCGSALRAIQKSLYAVEPRICELEKLSRFLPSHLETSLQVRRHYRKLWHFAVVLGDVTTSGVRAALRGAGTRISILAGSDVYSLLREDDRFYIQELQLRILDWLRDSTDASAGVRIWQDFALFVEILRQVNLREELLTHDRDVMFAAAAELAARDEEAMPEVGKLLSSILGVDDALDLVILSCPSAKTLLRELRRAAEQFGGMPDHSARSPSVAV
jgi:hypothetical protein